MRLGQVKNRKWEGHCLVSAGQNTPVRFGVMSLGSEINQSPWSKELDSGGTKANFLKLWVDLILARQGGWQSGIQWLEETLSSLQFKLLLRIPPVRTCYSVSVFSHVWILWRTEILQHSWVPITYLNTLIVSIFSFSLTVIFHLPSGYYVSATLQFCILQMNLGNKKPTLVFKHSYCHYLQSQKSWTSRICPLKSIRVTLYMHEITLMSGCCQPKCKNESAWKYWLVLMGINEYLN